MLQDGRSSDFVFRAERLFDKSLQCLSVNKQKLLGKDRKTKAIIAGYIYLKNKLVTFI